MSHALYKLGENQYCLWSTVTDSPISHIMGAEELMESFDEITPERVRRADENGHSWIDIPAETPKELVAFNRAGPNECCLTLEALLLYYNADPAKRPTKLLPEHIRPLMTSYVGDDTAYWVPWMPGQAPDEITDETDLHAMVKAITIEDVNNVLSHSLSPADIEQWWADEWECTCSVSHGSRREFFDLNPQAVLTIAEIDGN